VHLHISLQTITSVISYAVYTRYIKLLECLYNIILANTSVILSEIECMTIIDRKIEHHQLFSQHSVFSKFCMTSSQNSPYLSEEKIV
jgi:hypothetical protein